MKKPCSMCGREVQVRAKSLPEPVCHECRRSRRDGGMLPSVAPGYIPPSRRTECTGCGVVIRRSHTSAPEPYCLECRRVGRAPKSYGVSGYRRGCRCDDCRAAVRDQQREYAARRRAEGRPLHRARRMEERLCAECGSSFSTRMDSDARFCSLQCVGRSQRTRPPRKSVVRKRAERRARVAAKGSTGGGLVWVQGACAVCGDQFPPSPGASSRYCSRECRAEARSGARWIDYPVRLAIYRSTGWRCAICGEEMLRRFVLGDPLSPTLDHVVPRAHGGSDDVANLRPAHSICNSLRGDLTYCDDAAVRLARVA